MKYICSIQCNHNHISSTVVCVCEKSHSDKENFGTVSAKFNSGEFSKTTYFTFILCTTRVREGAGNGMFEQGFFLSEVSKKLVSVSDIGLILEENTV